MAPMLEGLALALALACAALMALAIKRVGTSRVTRSRPSSHPNRLRSAVPMRTRITQRELGQVTLHRLVQLHVS